MNSYSVPIVVGLAVANCSLYTGYQEIEVTNGTNNPMTLHFNEEQTQELKGWTYTQLCISSNSYIKVKNPTTKKFKEFKPASHHNTVLITVVNKELKFGTIEKSNPLGTCAVISNGIDTKSILIQKMKKKYKQLLIRINKQ